GRAAFRASPPVERPLPPHVDQGHEEEDDEDDHLDQHEDRVSELHDHAHRIEKDDLDVEEDEEHRDHVEAEPEPEGPRDLAREAAFIRIALRLGRLARSDEAVDRREQPAHQHPQAGEYEYGEVASKQARTPSNRRRAQASYIPTLCQLAT